MVVRISSFPIWGRSREPMLKSFGCRGLNLCFFGRAQATFCNDFGSGIQTLGAPRETSSVESIAKHKLSVSVGLVMMLGLILKCAFFENRFTLFRSN